MPLNRIQVELKKVLPEKSYETLYNIASDIYAVYQKVLDNTVWIPKCAYYFMKRDLGNLKRVGHIQKVLSHTLASKVGVQKTYDIAKGVNNLSGAFVECGVARGGCAAIMALVAKDEGKHRKTWLFDSFEGLPPQTNEDGIQNHTRHKDRRFNVLAEGYCLGTFEEVEHWLYSELCLNRNDVVIVKGWFQDTLPFCKDIMGGIAVLRLDCDWYESTKCCLDNIYRNVVNGGFVIIDDYQLEGCKKAVDEFIENNKLEVNITFDSDGRGYWEVGMHNSWGQK